MPSPKSVELSETECTYILCALAVCRQELGNAPPGTTEPRDAVVIAALMDKFLALLAHDLEPETLARLDAIQFPDQESH